VSTLTCHRLAWGWVVVFSALLGHWANAHPSDISYLKVKLARQQVEMRFTFNVLTLTRFVPEIDANADKQIDHAELNRAAPEITAYLKQHVLMEVNQKEATLGGMQPMECLWPIRDGKHSVAELDYAVRYVDVSFIQSVQPVLADVWLSFEIWEQTGPLGSIEATYEQDSLRTQVPFSISQPDYLYDTGYAVEDFFREPKEEVNQAGFLEKHATKILPFVNVMIPVLCLISLLGFLFQKRRR
jgi:hypothetical protein